MRSPYGFIRTAGRGSAYCTIGGAFWIIKSRSKWHLVQMARPAEGIERRTLGVFNTLAAAAEDFKNERRWEHERDAE